jgi:hypothetical protein
MRHWGEAAELHSVHSVLSAGSQKAQFPMQLWPGSFANVQDARCALGSLPKLVAEGLSETNERKNSAGVWF